MRSSRCHTTVSLPHHHCFGFLNQARILYLYPAQLSQHFSPAHTLPSCDMTRNDEFPAMMVLQACVMCPSFLGSSTGVGGASCAC